MTVLHQNRRWHFENGHLSTITFRRILSFWALSDHLSGISHKKSHNVSIHSSERIGYIAANPFYDEIHTLMSGLILSHRILGFINAPALMQRVIAELQHASINVDIYRRSRGLLVEGFDRAGYDFVKPEGAFYFFCKSPIEDDVRFARLLHKQNILVVPGSGFGCPGFFRISYAVQEKLFREAISRFNHMLESLV